MKIEITTEGQGRGTIVTVDGDRLKHVCALSLTIPADGFPVLEIEQLPQNEEGQFLLEFDEKGNRAVATKTLRIRGSVTFEGEAIALAHVGC